MDTKILFEKVFENNVQQLKNWEFNEIIGESLYKKYTGHYAFVKLKISRIDDCSQNQYINNLMQKFNLLKEYEDFGLYFSKDKIVTLSKIYTVDEITAAITILEPNLSV